MDYIIRYEMQPFSVRSNADEVSTWFTTHLMKKVSRKYRNSGQKVLEVSEI